MDHWVNFASRKVIIDESSELFGPEPPMHKPLLVPGCLKGSRCRLCKQTGNVPVPKGREALLSVGRIGRGQVGIARIKRTTHAWRSIYGRVQIIRWQFCRQKIHVLQNEAGIEVVLVADVDTNMV